MLSTKLDEHLERSQMNGINTTTTTTTTTNTTTTITTTTTTTTTTDNTTYHSKHIYPLTNRHNFYIGFIRLLNRSTIHGLSHISTASNIFSRIIWLILWLIGVAGFLTNLSSIVKHYLSHPILTSYINDYEQFQWPDIIFCNPMAPYNVYTTEKLKLWNYYVNLARNISNNIPKHLFSSIEELDTNEIIIQSLIHSTIPYWQFNVGNVNDMFQFIASDNGHQGIRLSVGLDENLIHIPTPLNKYFYTQIIQKRYNVPCYNFQISRNLNSTIYQRIEKLAFGIKFNYQSYLIINSSYTSHMIDLYITLPNHFPCIEPIELTPGYINHIKLEMIRIQRIKEHNNCHMNTYSTMIYDGDLLTKRQVYGNGELCHRILSQYLYLNECHCYSPFLPYGYYNHLIKSQPILCLNMSIFNNEQLVNNSNCMYYVYQKYSNITLYMSLLEAKQCNYYQYSPNCDNVDYNHLGGIHRKPMTELWSNTYNEARAAFLISSFRDVFTDTTNTTYNQYNSNIILSTHEILTKMRNNFGLLTIERSTSQGKLIREEQEYSLAQLLSDIGGNMGLWIGISVIGLFEFVEFFSYILYALLIYFIKLYKKN